MLKVKNLTKTRGKFTLQDITFDLEPGYIMGLIGPNGSGKSTLIELLMNLIKEDSGSIEIFGKDHREYEQEVKQHIGFVYDRSYYNPSMTIMETGRFLAPYYKNWDWAEFQRLLEIMELDGKEKLGELSKGNLTKAMIVFACCHHAKFILMDEPTSGLDPIVRRELVQLFQDILADGETSLLYSTHITSDLEKVADYITFINEGKLVFSDTQEVIKEEHKLIRVGGEQGEILNALDVVGYERNGHGIEALVRGDVPEQVAVVETPTLEDLMYFYKIGGRRHV